MRILVGCVGCVESGSHSSPSRGLKRNTTGLERGGVTFGIVSAHSSQNPQKGVVWERVWLERRFVGTGSAS